MIDKDTLLFCSFAKEAGNKGCQFFNTGFEKLGLNAIYKSFSVDNIWGAMEAMKTLNITGAGISMPFKKEVLHSVDEMDEVCETIGAANTILNQNGKLVARNTDWLAALKYLAMNNCCRFNDIYILGDGGYAAAVTYAAKHLDFNIVHITRDTWEDIIYLRKTLIFNCTPVADLVEWIDSSNYFIDCIPNTVSGAQLSHLQAQYQFQLYTGLEWKI